MKIYSNRTSSCFKDLNSKQSKIITIEGKEFVELTNIIFDLNFDKHILKEKLELPNNNDKKEREYLISRLPEVINVLNRDINSRRAVFTNLYDNNLGKCISLVHFFVREGKVNLNTYFRSQEASKNFFYDYQTHMILIKKVSDKLKLEPGKITIFVANFHLEIK